MPTLESGELEFPVEACWAHVLAETAARLHATCSANFEDERSKYESGM